MKYKDTVIIKRFIPILKEYQRTNSKVTPDHLSLVNILCLSIFIEY